MSQPPGAPPLAGPRVKHLPVLLLLGARRNEGRHQQRAGKARQLEDLLPAAALPHVHIVLSDRNSTLCQHLQQVKN